MHNHSLLIVASAYAEQYNIGISIGGNEASTDGKHIQLPAIKSENYATWKDALWGYLAHEASHIKFTDFNLFQQCANQFEHSILNSLEDVRIENAIINEFPGTAQTLDATMHHIFDVLKGFRAPDEQQTEAAILAMYILLKVRHDYRDMDYLKQELETTRTVLATQFKPIFIDILDALLIDCERMQSTQDAVHIKDAIINLIKDKPDSSTAPCKDNDLSSLAQRLLEDASVDPKGIGELLAEGLTQAASKEGTDSTSIDVSVGTGSKSALTYGTDQAYLAKALSTSSALTAQLQGLVQSKQRVRSAPARSGRKINPKRLARVAVGETKIFQRHEVRKKTDTAIHVLVDSSRSMNGQEQTVANQTTYALATALQAIRGVSTAISTFPGAGAPVSSVMSAFQSPRLCPERFDLKSSGGTPMAAAVLYGVRQLLTANKSKRLLFIITDGKSNQCDTSVIQDMVSHYPQIRCIGVGIGLSTNVHQLFPQHIALDSITQLRDALFDVCREIL